MALRHLNERNFLCARLRTDYTLFTANSVTSASIHQAKESVKSVLTEISGHSVMSVMLFVPAMTKTSTLPPLGLGSSPEASGQQSTVAGLPKLEYQELWRRRHRARLKNYYASYREKNRARILSSNRKWRLSDKGKDTERNYRKRNLPTITARVRAWYKSHPDMERRHKRAYRHRRREILREVFRERASREVTRLATTYIRFLLRSLGNYDPSPAAIDSKRNQILARRLRKFALLTDACSKLCKPST